MEHEALSDILAMGETASVEFKRCGQQPERDAFETVCSFANTFGGSIYLGVEDDGSVAGVKADGLLPVKRNIVNVVNNPKLFDSPVAVEFEELDFDGRALLRVWVPPSPNMHRFKGEICERPYHVERPWGVRRLAERRSGFGAALLSHWRNGVRDLA